MILLRRLWENVVADRYFQMAAALSYYTVLSITPLLLLIVQLASWFMDSGRVNREVVRWLERLMGPSAGQQLADILEKAPESLQVNSWIGVGLLLVAATGVVSQLQQALNTVWRIEVKQNVNWVRDLLVKRLLSFAMILAIAFVLQVSMMTQTLLAMAGEHLSSWLSLEGSSAVLGGINNVIFFFLIWLIFAAMYRFLPDVHLRWKHVAYGALATTILFLVGQVLLGYYLAESSVGDSFGAAGKLIAVLVWVYYASLTVLLGAGFAHVWTTQDGYEAPPEAAAQKTEAHGGDLETTSAC